MELGMGLGAGTVEVRMEFDSFFHAHFEKVARAAALVTRDAAAGQDLAQEAFMRLLERWGTMESDDHARNFAFKVALNLARSHLRKHGRLSLYGVRGPDAPGTTDHTGSSDTWLGMAEALGALSPRQRACVVLVDYVDMDPAAAAAALGMSPGTVRVHLMRGRRALREALGMTQREEEA
ncbi:MAG TPA: sigma-70 family RNA polymerase sigma factor [Actinomycetota bacterium]